MVSPVLGIASGGLAGEEGEGISSSGGGGGEGEVSGRGGKGVGGMTSCGSRGGSLGSVGGAVVCALTEPAVMVLVMTTTTQDPQS